MLRSARSAKCKCVARRENRPQDPRHCGRSRSRIARLPLDPRPVPANFLKSSDRMIMCAFIYFFSDFKQRWPTHIMLACALLRKYGNSYQLDAALRCRIEQFPHKRRVSIGKFEKSFPRTQIGFVGFYHASRGQYSNSVIPIFANNLHEMLKKRDACHWRNVPVFANRAADQM